jgi:ketosteroid isomerase-like protein
MPDTTIETEIAALRGRVRKLEDIEEIRTLRMLYHHYVNVGEFDRVADLYTEDAEFVMGDVAQGTGRAAIAEIFEGVARSMGVIQQYMCNHIVEVAGDQATGVAYLDARYARDEDSVMSAIRYDEAYRRTASGWKISETLISNYFAVPISVGWSGANRHFQRPLDQAS